MGIGKDSLCQLAQLSLDQKKLCFSKPSPLLMISPTGVDGCLCTQEERCVCHPICQQLGYTHYAGQLCTHSRASSFQQHVHIPAYPCIPPYPQFPYQTDVFFSLILHVALTVLKYFHILSPTPLPASLPDRFGSSVIGIVETYFVQHHQTTTASWSKTVAKPVNGNTDKFIVINSN